MQVEMPDNGPAADVPDQLGSYNWGQDDEEITLEILVPAGTTSKQIAVTFKPTTVKVEVNTLEEGKRVVIDAELWGKAEGEESSWGLCDSKGGRQLTVTIAKHYTTQGHWSSFLKE